MGFDGPPPDGFPFDNGFVCIVRPTLRPLKNGPPLFAPPMGRAEWVAQPMGGVGPPIGSTHSELADFSESQN